MAQRSIRPSILTTGAVTLVLAVIFACFGMDFPIVFVPMHVAIYLVIGWVPFLMRVGPHLTIRWDMVGSTIVYAVALAAGVHFFLRWLYREMAQPIGDTTRSRSWRFRWTLAGFVLVILMFGAGISAIGVVHQTTWLLRSPVPILAEDNWHELAYRIKCASNLRQIGQATSLYAHDHTGKYPDDFLPLFLECDINAEVFTCPASMDDKATGSTPQEIASRILTPGHCSYIYFGKGLSEPVDPNKVIAVEHATNHELDGMNVLLADGHVDWLDQPAADELMQKLGFKREQGKPDWQPTTRP